MQRGIRLVGIVRQHIGLGVALLAQGNHLEFHILEHQTLVALGTEEHLLAVTQRDGVLGTGGLVACKEGVGLIVEDDAVLQHLRDGHTRMFGGCDEALLREHHLDIHRAGKEGTLGTDDQLTRVKGLLDRAVGRGLGDFTQLRGGGVLALREAVDLVVEEDEIQIDIATNGVDEVVTTDGQRVAVARSHPDREVGIGRLDARSDGGSTAVYGVETKGLHIVDEA